MPYGGAKNSENFIAGAKTTNRKKPKESAKESKVNDDF